MDTAHAQRIVVVGTSGSGKTTLAAELAAGLGYPHIELDALHWEPNWQPAPLEVLRQRVAAAIAADAWVIDGNYSRVRDLVWARAEMVVWLDYPYHVVMSRMIRRTFKRVVGGQELWNGNRDRLGAVFGRESIIWWAATTYRRRKREYPALLARPEHAHLRVVHLTSPRQTRQWLAAIVAAATGQSVVS